jgi:hypothetical protein
MDSCATQPVIAIRAQLPGTRGNQEEDRTMRLM